MEYTDMIDSSTPMTDEDGNGTAWSAGPYLNNSWEGVNATNGTFINKFYFYESVQFAVMWILLVAIVVGNSTVILALLLSKARKSRMNYFIMQLAIADLWVGLFSVLTDIVQRITIVWVAGNLACKCIRFLQGIVTYSSTYVLVALSIDRCDAITHPMNFTGSWSRARGLIITAWTLSIIFSIPMLILYEEKHIQGQLQCWIDLGTPSRWQLWMTSVFISLFVLPAVTIAACYTIIVLTIRTKSQAVMPPNKKKKASRQYSDDIDSRRASSRGIIPKAKIKTVKMTFVIVFVFIICWLPYMVFDLLQVYECIPNTQTSMAVATLIQSLAPLNSAANPVIYCIFSSRVFISLRTLPPYKWLCWWRSSATKSHAAHTELLTSSHKNRMRTFRASANTRAADCASRQQSERHPRATSTRQVRLVLPEEPP